MTGKRQHRRNATTISLSSWHGAGRKVLEKVKHKQHSLKRRESGSLPSAVQAGLYPLKPDGGCEQFFRAPSLLVSRMEGIKSPGDFNLQIQTGFFLLLREFIFTVGRCCRLIIPATNKEPLIKDILIFEFLTKPPTSTCCPDDPSAAAATNIPAAAGGTNKAQLIIWPHPGEDLQVPAQYFLHRFLLMRRPSLSVSRVIGLHQNPAQRCTLRSRTLPPALPPFPPVYSKSYNAAIGWMLHTPAFGNHPGNGVARQGKSNQSDWRPPPSHHACHSASRPTSTPRSEDDRRSQLAGSPVDFAGGARRFLLSARRRRQPPGHAVRSRALPVEHAELELPYHS